MVDCIDRLDVVFHSLSDPTRRDILRRVAKTELSIGEISKAYTMTFAAISKHLKVLERAELIVKRRKGKEQMVQLAPKTLTVATDFLKEYQRIWEQRLDALEAYLKIMP